MSSVTSLSVSASKCFVTPAMAKRAKPSRAALALGKRLKECREAARLSQSQLARELGLKSREAVSQWESGKSSPENERLRSAAVLFGCSYDWLATGRGSPNPTNSVVVGLNLIGDIAAGVWREISESQDMEYERVPVAPVKDYPVEAQYALKVHGNSVDRVAKDGATIHCVDVGRAGLTPREGDLVCVERNRAGLREMTVKRIRMGAEGLELWPESNDPAHQEKLSYKPPRGSGEVIIKAIVIGSFTAIPRGS